MRRNFGWLFLVMLPAGALAGLLLAAVVTYVIPKQYESSAVIELKPLHWDMPIESTESEGEAPAWVLAEIEEMRNNEPDQSGEAIANVKRELEIEQETLEVLKRKLMGETIAAKISDDRTPIHEMPRISHEPVFPNVTLNLVLGAVLGLLLSPLMALLTIMMIRRRIPAAPAG